jgi:protein-S-isoprenylcysteine O-methyltransferase Ste14
MELKVPPPVVVLVTMALQWQLARFAPALEISIRLRLPAAGSCIAIGAALLIAAVSAFYRARTTVSPTRPGTTSAIVMRGVYRFSRNPMYLGFLLVLLGSAIIISNLLAFALLPFFVAYIHRYQIIPEERILAKNFGAEFEAYSRKVRRWL